MMFHGEKDHLATAHQIEHEIFVRHKFTQVVFFVEESAQCLGQCLCFCRFDGVTQKGSTGLRELAQRGNGVIEETIENPAVC